MIILPAIDIINKQPVRLTQGDYNQKEVVGNSILEIAKSFEAAGAKYVHMVDLDGAKEGKSLNQDVILEVAKTLSIPIEIGGGIRKMETVKAYLDNGVGRVILGTSALEDETFLKEALALYDEKIAVGIDARNGFVCGKGWLEQTSVNYLEFAKHLEELGVKTIIVTDISKDGTLSGINQEMYKTLKENVNMNIIASGGVKSMEDVKACANLDLYGVITGKAIYHGQLDLKEALAYVK